MKFHAPLQAARSCVTNPTSQRRRKPLGAQDANPLQRLADQSGQIGLLQQLQADADGYVQRVGLVDNLKAGVGGLLDMSTDGVRVPYNASKPAQLNALAHAKGAEIHLGLGQEQHLPHEAWHVVQQADGHVKSTASLKSRHSTNDRPNRQGQAHTMGVKTLQMGSAPVPQRYPEKAAPQSYGSVAQCVMTRAMVDQFVTYVQQYKCLPPMYYKLDAYEQHLVLGRVESATGLDLGTAAFGQEQAEAENNSDVDHPDTSGAEEITQQSDPSLYSQLYQLKAYAVQLKRGPGPSGKKSFSTTNVGNYTDVEYKRDAVGNIDFAFPHLSKVWSNPVAPPAVDLSEDSKNKEYGKTLSGSFVHIPSASRGQHFSIANRVAKKHRTTAGEGGNSPNGWTWHHLLDRYKMMLVDRAVHQKFGHNGGFYFW